MISFWASEVSWGQYLRMSVQKKVRSDITFDFSKWFHVQFDTWKTESSFWNVSSASNSPIFNVLSMNVCILRFLVALSEIRRTNIRQCEMVHTNTRSFEGDHNISPFPVCQLLRMNARWIQVDYYEPVTAGDFQSRYGCSFAVWEYAACARRDNNGIINYPQIQLADEMCFDVEIPTAEFSSCLTCL